MRPESTALTSPRADVLTETVEGFGTVRFTPVDPATDSAVLHSWVVEERAQFWGMNGASRELVQEIYEDVDRRDTHHAYMVRLDDEPVALFQTYEPSEDRISECYPVREGDIGVHLMLAPVTGRPRPGGRGGVRCVRSQGGGGSRCGASATDDNAASARAGPRRAGGALRTRPSGVHARRSRRASALSGGHHLARRDLGRSGEQ
ncbi:GNAT family N-acetyltransferase [Streptomyces sp. NRRL S-98]|uniref:GNAT family N-acetyltransferase n=1 Tax=Streptomyces sp. NRRL S-98 TaxID=1463922 RepID=UPI0020A66700|nr:GNAT family N-acetyltransferase [Streptomyces sp. NRRL S-98]